MRSIALLLLFATPTFAQPLVAPTDAKTPEEERKSFKLPPGFTAQLVASEPEIQKPMQLAFDAKGRIWVTTSYHYPFAAETGKASDKLFILSDFDANGKAQKVETFDDKLNIPIGILPLPDCKSCIVSSVGEILKLTDTDGDGKADQREVLFTGFGSRDTHGMYNSYTYMPDGWVYACHGFANDSHVKGKDGHEVHLNSGNTFRFRPDGSRIEVYTRGQVNPFGMTVDPWFNFYTADCHSKPITQLIKGAYYDSFGKPHDGLGYAPHVTRHDHGSTGLCGLAWYDADHFPKEWNGVMFLGNVVTGRINIDRIEWKGSTPVAKELPDFLVSGDPWFRPVDIKLGPDGALYVNDFYNKIIGHYEVDLKHPGRDKGRGRMWRIVSTDHPSPKMPFADLTKETPEKLFELTGSANMTVRHMATRELIERGKSIGPLLPIFDKKSSITNPNQFLHLSWVALRLDYYHLNPDGIKQHIDFNFFDQLHMNQFHSVYSTESSGVRKKIINNPKRLISPGSYLFYGHLFDKKRFPEGQSQVWAKHERALVNGLLEYSEIPDIMLGELVAILHHAPSDDSYLRHATKRAIRQYMMQDDLQEHLVWILKDHIAPVVRDDVTVTSSKIVDEIMLSVPTAYAGWWLSERLKAGTLDPAFVERAYLHIGRYGCNCHRDVAWGTGEGIADRGTRIQMLTALKNGTITAGTSYKPGVGADILRQVQDGLISKNDTTVLQSFEMVKLIDFDASAAALNLMGDAKRSEAVRLAAFGALDKLPKEKLYSLCNKVLADATTPAGLREKAIATLLTSPKLNDQIVLKDMLKTAAYRQCVAIATGLASTKSGVDLLFADVKAGKASARLLQEKTVLERLKATNAANWEANVKELTAGIPSADARLAALIKERGDGYRKSKHDIEAGKKIFASTCANCHQVGGLGAKVGPQLDGIGNRGVERLLEDTLDPNRNVDHAFHTTILDLKDGGQLTGLLRVEGNVLIVVDSQAKEKRVSVDDVDKKRTSPVSPMPSDIAEKLKPKDFYDLIAYLADLKAK